MRKFALLFIVCFVTFLFLVGCEERKTVAVEPKDAQVDDLGERDDQNKTVELSNEQVEDIVRRSYQYVTLYNVNNKFAHQAGGWNKMMVDTKLKDHTLRDIARPNNDTLWPGCLT